MALLKPRKHVGAGDRRWHEPPGSLEPQPRGCQRLHKETPPETERNPVMGWVRYGTRLRPGNTRGQNAEILSRGDREVFEALTHTPRIGSRLPIELLLIQRSGNAFRLSNGVFDTRTHCLDGRRNVHSSLLTAVHRVKETLHFFLGVGEVGRDSDGIQLGRRERTEDKAVVVKEVLEDIGALLSDHLQRE